MKHNITIAGLSLSTKFCHKINKEQIKSIYISEEPLTTIYKSQQEGAYTVNIVAYVPTSLKNLKDINLGSGIFLNEEKTLFLNYNGVSNVNTSVQKTNDSGVLLCREFNVEYDCDDQVLENYNLYHIQFDYKLLPKKFQSVEAIIVKLINEDPVTDRGTVTTVRDDDN
ncbi:hypothetical protein [uncultured Algibacter sp.]|uniref:hypothetical protein n=1 Tax=uncultured Algibacter sp. TaxID=298659 RepID=UPI003216E6FC